MLCMGTRQVVVTTTEQTTRTEVSICTIGHTRVSYCMLSCCSPGRFAVPQEFPELKGTLLQELDIIDGDWQVVVTAPGGGVVGSALAPVSGPKASAAAGMAGLRLLTSWGECVPQNESKLALCRQVNTSRCSLGLRHHSKPPIGGSGPTHLCLWTPQSSPPPPGPE